MKRINFKSLLTAVFLIITLKGFCQIEYEKGYFINNDGEKTETLILNKDWKDNPTEFNYAAASGGESQTGSISSVKEFGIGNTAKYVRANVKIDRSSPVVKQLTSDRNPVWKEELLFLKVVAEGPATLFKYEDGNLVRFFFRKNDSETEQLIYKKYREGERVGENNTYKGQLNYGLNCTEISDAKIASLSYTENKLKEYFVLYNKCQGLESVLYKEESVNRFYLRITPGVSFSAFKIDFPAAKLTEETERIPVFRIGIQPEFILPFNKNKWSIFAEPTFQKFSAEIEVDSKSYIEKVIVEHKYIDIPVGIRHYCYLNENSKIFVNGAFVLSFSSGKGTVDLIRPWNSTTLEVDEFHHFAFGGGIMVRRISAEIRAFTNKNILWNSGGDLVSEYRNMSLIIGVRIL